MTNRPAPALPKWPFILADVLLLIACAWVINLLLPAKAYFAIGLAIVGWMVGAWVCVLPWLKEFQAECKLSESENLTSARSGARIIELFLMTSNFRHNRSFKELKNKRFALA